jgi:hypothetical protein
LGQIDLRFLIALSDSAGFVFSGFAKGGVDGAFLTGGLASDDFDIARFYGCSMSERRARCKRIKIRRTQPKKSPRLKLLIALIDIRGISRES